MDWDAITKELNKKLDPSAVKPAKSFGPKGDYIEGWHAIAEANRIFGFGGWHYLVPECTCVFQGSREISKDKKPGFGVTYTAKVCVYVGHVQREDFGAGHGYDVDCGLAHESAIKEAVTDALKRALRTFGNPFGLALYDKSRENVGVDLPTATPAEIEAAVEHINGLRMLSGLRLYWEQLNRNAPHVAASPEVIKAKDARKSALQRPAFEPAGPDEGDQFATH